jgi:hypothetical protein
VVSHSDENVEGMIQASYVSYIMVDLPVTGSDVRTQHRQIKRCNLSLHFYV